MEYANDVSGGRLLPADRTQRAQARAILAWQHSGLSGICTRISFESAFYPVKRSLTPAEVSECEPLLTVLARSLAGSGGPYLFGPLSLADLALAPTVVRLTRHNLDLGSFAPVDEWTRALLDRPSVTEWMLEADRLPHIWFDEYLLDAGQELVSHPSRGRHPRRHGFSRGASTAPYLRQLERLSRDRRLPPLP